MVFPQAFICLWKCPIELYSKTQKGKTSMTTNKRVFYSILLACFLALGLFTATLSLFTDKDTDHNTYSINNVRISLDEAKVNNNGQAIDSLGNIVDDPKQAERVFRNRYTMMPGHTYIKDPTVTVAAGSTDCYIRLIITLTKADVLSEVFENNSFTQLFNNYNDEDWICISSESDKSENTYTYVFQFKDLVKKAASDVRLPPIFTGISIPGELTQEQLLSLHDFRIDIIAQAHIDEEGFKDFELD